MGKKTENQAVEEKETALVSESKDSSTDAPGNTNGAAKEKPEVKENPGVKKDGRLYVENKKRAGMTVFAVTGKPVVFNADGLAEVDSADYAYLKTVPGYDTK